MQNPRSSPIQKKEVAQPPLNLKYERYSTILRPSASPRSTARRSIVKEDVELDDRFGVPQLIHQQRRRLLRNLFFISTIKAAAYLFRDTIVNNWADPTLNLVHYILSNLFLILVTPFIVPPILRIFTLRTSIRFSVIAMTFVALTSYCPFPYVFTLQAFVRCLPESVLSVAVRIYMVRIAKIWSRIDSIDLRASILRIFALHNVLLHLRHVLVACIKYSQPEVHESASDFSDYPVNATCGLYYCELTRHLIVNYVYDVKYKSFDQTLILSTVLIVLAAGLSIGISVILDRLDALSDSEFGDQPTVCKTIDVFLQLCRPRMTYLLGIAIYHPFLITLRQQYLEAYATCALETKHDHMIVIVVSLAGLHAILSAEVFLDGLGIVRSLEVFLGIFTTTFVILSFWNDGATLNVIVVFVVYYLLQYWTSIYGLFVALLTQQLIGDEEIAAWAIHAIIFSIGLSLSQAFHYMCMNINLHFMIVFGVIVLTMTYCMRRENRKNLFTAVMKSSAVEAFERKSKAWIADPWTNLGKAVDMGGEILWIETYWRRTVRIVRYPTEE